MSILQAIKVLVNAWRDGILIIHHGTLERSDAIDAAIKILERFEREATKVRDVIEFMDRTRESGAGE